MQTVARHTPATTAAQAAVHANPHTVGAARNPLPLNQLAFSVLDLKTTERWWREGLGFLPAGGNRLLFRGPVMDAIQGMQGVATTCWCLLGRNDWAQVEMFQYEAPMSKRMPPDFKPNHIGYTRCGLWVADLDAALTNLARLGTQPLAPPIGEAGNRRVCVRNPDGVYVELMEDDPLPHQNRHGRTDCPVAIRSVTMSTPDLHQSVAFITRGLGMREVPATLHGDAHEALWGLAGADCTRRVFEDGSGNATLLLEVVQYHAPRGVHRPRDYRVCDQGMLNICFGDARSRHGVVAMRDRAVAAGASTNSRIINILVSGCVYLNDPLGFSYEFMWAAPGLGQRQFGFVVRPTQARPQLDNQHITCAAHVAATPAQTFAALTQHAGFSAWAALGKTTAGGLQDQVIACEPNALLRYRTARSWVFVGYIGEIRLAPERTGTRVVWNIRFRARILGLGAPLRYLLRRSLAQTLALDLGARLANAEPQKQPQSLPLETRTMTTLRLILINISVSVLVVAGGHALSYFFG